MFILIPQLGATFGSLGSSIQNFVPKVQKWAENVFEGNEQIRSWIGNLNFDWNRIMEVGVDFSAMVQAICWIPL